MNKYVIISCIIAGIALAVLTIILILPEKQNGPVTCTSDAQCGGVITGEQFCKDGDIYGKGQKNTCVNAGKTTSRCETIYGDVLVEDCKNDCEDEECI